MRFRRFRRHSRRGRREPLRWFRGSYLNAPFQTSFTAPRVSVVQMFRVDTIVPGFVDEQITIRRLVINRAPVVSVPDDLIFVGGTSFTVSLTWYLYVRRNTDTDIPVDPTALFFRGADVIQGGVLQARVDAPNGMIVPAWGTMNAERNGNWIDTKVARRLNTNDVLCLWTQANTWPYCAGGFPFAGGESGDLPCWVHDWDLSLLYQRAMR